jgi:hypothetical protein
MFKYRYSVFLFLCYGLLIYVRRIWTFVVPTNDLHQCMERKAQKSRYLHRLTGGSVLRARWRYIFYLNNPAVSIVSRCPSPPAFLLRGSPDAAAFAGGSRTFKDMAAELKLKNHINSSRSESLSKPGGHRDRSLIPAWLLDSLEAGGFICPTDIQRRAIPVSGNVVNGSYTCTSFI